jgi:uncharacterized protein (TIGR00159 family)
MDICFVSFYPEVMEKVLGANVTDNFSRIVASGNPFHLTGSLYFTDLLDILIITLLLYSVFLLFKRTRSLLIMVGLVITLALYAFAKFFNLYLTSLALQYFFGVFFIVFAIIFQQEIRKFFEWVGLIGTRRIKVSPLAPKSPTTAEIIQACVKMAQSKTGALIVLQGKDNLDEFCEGGVTLDGNISEEILLSVFDPHSEGHDGALIISNNRIFRFGTHLPLSNNFKEIGKHGTRHSAALGLAENTDALSIVISEEKGSISICRDGKMKKLEYFSDLEKELDKFIKEKYFPKNTSATRQVFNQNMGFKFAALLSASLIWFFSAYQAGIVKKTYTVSIDFLKLPDNVLIENYSPKSVLLTVDGRGDVAFSGLKPEDFGLEIDASSVTNGINKFNLSPAMFRQPLNLNISSIEPETVLLTAKKYFSAQVPVRVKTKGEPAKGYHTTSIAVTPESLDLLVPEAATTPAEIATDIIDLTDQKESFVVPIKLVLPEGIKPDKPENTSVNVAITIEKL